MPGTRRELTWRNEHNQIVLAAGTQASADIGGVGNFVRNSTVTRILVDLQVTPVTLNVPVQIAYAIWVGNFLGIPGNIEIDSDERFLLWNAVTFRVGLLGEGGFFMNRIHDVRGQRKARQDNEGPHFVARVDGGSAVNVEITTRVLIRLP